MKTKLKLVSQTGGRVVAESPAGKTGPWLFVLNPVETLIYTDNGCLIRVRLVRLAIKMAVGLLRSLGCLRI